MSHRLFLTRIALTLTIGLMFVASATQATTLGNSAIAQATDSGGVVPFPFEPTRVTTTLTGIVTTPRLRVRDAASFKGKVIFSLKRGQMVTLLGIHLNRRWLKIQTGDGKVGWVSAYYIELVGGTLKMLAFVQ